MKRHLLGERIIRQLASLTMVTALLFFMSGVTTARADTDSDEKKLDTEVTTLDKDAGAAEGQKVVIGRLEKEFGVTDTEIQSLRDKKLGFGEITIVFSLAQKLPGGITDANISKIMTLREGPPVMGWGEIAKKLGFKLGPVVSNVKKIAKASHKEIEKAEHEKINKGEDRGEEMKEERNEHSGMGREPMERMRGRE